MSLVCFRAWGHLNCGFTYHQHHTCTLHVHRMAVFGEDNLAYLLAFGCVHLCSFNDHTVLQNLRFQEWAKNRFIPVSITSHLLSVIFWVPYKGDQLAFGEGGNSSSCFGHHFPWWKMTSDWKVAFRQSMHFLSSRNPAKCECMSFLGWPGRDLPVTHCVLLREGWLA